MLAARMIFLGKCLYGMRIINSQFSKLQKNYIITYCQYDEELTVFHKNGIINTYYSFSFFLINKNKYVVSKNNK